MGGGLMQLVAYGAQDIYLSGNPQITFFKVVYRRHTNFAVESIEQTFNGSAAAGSKISVTVSRNGDLLSQVWLVNNGSKGGVMTSERAFGQIDNVEVEIGGQVIDKQYGHWMQVWTDLSNPTDKTALLDSCAKTTTSTGENSYVPLQFWFCRNPGLALPLIALQYHEVKLNVTFSTAAHQLGTVSVWCDYVFLDTDERRRFAQVSHEYLIEQVQYSNALSVDSGADTTTQHELRFNHPVKELVWTVHGGAAEVTGPSGSEAPPKDTDITVTNALLQLNGHDRFKRRDGKYFTTVQRYQHHSGSSDAVNRLALQDTNVHDTGGTDVTTEAVQNLKRGAEAGGTALVFNTPTYVKVKINGSALTLKTGTVAGTIATLAGAGVAFIAFNYTATTYRLYPVTGGIKGALSGVGALWVQSKHMSPADIVAGGDQQFELKAEEQDAGNSIPHVYSFALKPEEHQPSGTCNFSRIDNAVLNMEHATVAAPATLKVYAVNYNVLRIMSGMGGLAYSN
jgi:hypothetical protein